MSTTTMNAMTASVHTATGPSRVSRKSRVPSLAMAKFLQQRAALPEMPEQESHAAAFLAVAVKLAAAAVPVSALAWLAVAG
jgi:hypothetical protein